MRFTLRNVANIKNGTFEIEENKLNIFYALNGTGKTSLTSAIQLKTETDDRIIKEITERLTPYDGSGKPEVSGDPINNLYVFNEDYVRRNLFNKNDNLPNTFEIVINTPDYEARVERIKNLLSLVTQTIEGNDGFLPQFNDDIRAIDKEFTTTKAGMFHSIRSGFAQLNTGLVTSKVKDGNSLKSFISDPLKAGDWKRWFDEGFTYENDTNRCPFCGSILNNDNISDQQEVNDNCEVKSVQKSLKASQLIHSLTKYLAKQQNDFIEGILKSGRPFDAQTIQCIQDLLAPLKDESDKINTIIAKNADELIKLVGGGKLANELPGLKLDLGVFAAMEKFPGAEACAKSVNDSLDKLIEESTQLSEELKQLQKTLNNNIEGNRKYVNDFLTNAGMPYEIDIKSIDGEYKTLLMPKDVNSDVKNPTKHLSYGERNALSLLLFSLDVRNKQSDLIILDDPISSFDNSKKFALMHQMFGDVENQTNLRGKTVLMVTHDFTIVCDVIRNNLFGLLPKKDVILAKASFLRNDKGSLAFKDIGKKDIKTVANFEKSLMKEKDRPKICRMFHLRKYLELTCDMDDHKYNLVSSWMHGDTTPAFINHDPIPDAEEMIGEIKEMPGMGDFDYSSWLEEQTDDKIVEAYNYPDITSVEKLQIARFYLDKTHNNKSYDRILVNYLNSACHIEGDLTMELDSKKFETTPPHVLSFCDKIIEDIGK